MIHLLKEKTGLNLEYYRRTFILRRLKARMIRMKINDLKKYNSFLLSNKTELKQFKDAFTINYTYFFRDWDVYATLQNIFLKSLNIEKEEKFLEELRPDCPEDGTVRKKRRALLQKEIVYSPSLFDNLKNLSIYRKLINPRILKRPINIWSCACASGEEPYSIAMIINNLSNKIPNFCKFRIIASDIDKYAIEDAKKAVYTQEKMKNVPILYENKYFKKEMSLHGYLYYLSKAIKESITLLNEDITKIDIYPWKFDLIFCRNLLIYFNIQNRNKFLKILEKQLKKGGLLFLGKTETILNENSSLKIIDPIHHIYIKKF
ncbi:MAG: CheR family methyltransferase [Promethearchaeota archaeon]